jgi:hypothetical protein
VTLGFMGACDTAKGICVAHHLARAERRRVVDGTMSTGSTRRRPGCDVDGGIDGGGCYNCTPADDREL